MLLTEIVGSTTTFFHGSPTKLPIEQKLTAKPSDGSFRSSSVITEIMEKHRPNNQPSRMRCWFLVDSLPMLNLSTVTVNYVYKVTPISQIYKHYYGWISLAEDYVRKEAFKLYQASENNINGVTPFVSKVLKTAEQDIPEFKQCIVNYWNGTPIDSNQLSVSAKMRGGSLVEYTTETIKVLELVKRKK